MSDKMYRVRGDLSRSRNWWASLAGAEWPALLAPARALLQGQEALLDLDAAEAFRLWAVRLPGWPRSPAEGAPPISFACIGYADEHGDKRIRWPIGLFVSPAERGVIEDAARRSGRTVGSYLRDLALADQGAEE